MIKNTPIPCGGAGLFSARADDTDPLDISFSCIVSILFRRADDKFAAVCYNE